MQQNAVQVLRLKLLHRYNVLGKLLKMKILHKMTKNEEIQPPKMNHYRHLNNQKIVNVFHILKILKRCYFFMNKLTNVHRDLFLWSGNNSQTKKRLVLEEVNQTETGTNGSNINYEKDGSSTEEINETLQANANENTNQVNTFIVFQLFMFFFWKNFGTIELHDTESEDPLDDIQKELQISQNNKHSLMNEIEEVILTDKGRENVCKKFFYCVYITFCTQPHSKTIFCAKKKKKLVNTQLRQEYLKVQQQRMNEALRYSKVVTLIKQQQLTKTVNVKQMNEEVSRQLDGMKELTNEEEEDEEDNAYFETGNTNHYNGFEVHDANDEASMLRMLQKVVVERDFLHNADDVNTLRSHVSQQLRSLRQDVLALQVSEKAQEQQCFVF
ncbi:hypothetical protein RFI_14033, partial [Reticulomyxa filosa]